MVPRSTGKIPRKIEDTVRYKSKNFCCICGVDDLPSTSITELHHINGKHLDHREDNLAPLCSNHQTQAHTTAVRGKVLTGGMIKRYKKQWEKLVLKQRESNFRIISSQQHKLAPGGRSNNKNSFFEKLYQKMTGAQLRFLLVLKESMKIGGRGMDCGYVSRYFQNIIKSKTDRYDGWITPFITAHLQENGLVSVADNFFRLNKIGEDFLNYIEGKRYKISDKEL